MSDTAEDVGGMAWMDWQALPLKMSPDSEVVATAAPLSLLRKNPLQNCPSISYSFPVVPWHRTAVPFCCCAA